MNNEIEEILNYLAFLEDVDTQKKIKKVVDYITNLQQENERLRNNILTTPFTKNTRERDIYKSRIEKAVEYIENIKKYGVYMVNGNNLLDILNGRSDE